MFDYDSPSGVKIVESIPVPRRGHGNALIKVHSCGVNPVDAKYIIGDKLPESWMSWSARKANGHTPGFDFSGVIVDVAPSNHLDLKVGDEVFGFACNPAHLVLRPWSRLHGSFAEYVTAPLDQLARKPAALSHTVAAALPLAGTTALQAFKQHSVREGQRVLIIGASGGVGHVAVQVAKHMGTRVAAVCSSRNASFVTECGADAVLTYDDGDVFNKIAADVASVGAYDFVLDCVSSADPRDSAHGYAARVRSMSPPVIACGKGADAHCYVVLGGATRHWGTALLKRFFHINCFEQGFELFWIKMPRSCSVLQQLATFADASSGEGRPRPLRPRVSTVLELSESGAQRAFDELRGRHTSGKIVLDVIASHS